MSDDLFVIHSSHRTGSSSWASPRSRPTGDVPARSHLRTSAAHAVPVRVNLAVFCSVLAKELAWPIQSWR
jgi:hypothetical protein